MWGVDVDCSTRTGTRKFNIIGILVLPVVKGVKVVLKTLLQTRPELNNTAFICCCCTQRAVYTKVAPKRGKSVGRRITGILSLHQYMLKRL